MQYIKGAFINKEILLLIMSKCLKFIPFCLFFLFLFCSVNVKSFQDQDSESEETNENTVLINRITSALNNSKILQSISENIQNKLSENQEFLIKLQEILLKDPYLWIFVDKEHPLDSNYEPNDLVELKNAAYVLNNVNLRLRSIAAASLEEMAAAAKKDGITLIISSAHRSYVRQSQIYSQHVKEMGVREADKVSARPGFSQHQLGLTVDFGSITNDFAKTAQGIWLYKNASRFGWSLSYPEGYENITGYSWESWHYRYVGIELAEFIDKDFNGIQHYALKFINEYINEEIKN